MSATTLQSYRYLILGKFGSAFPAFKYRNYRLYFSGQLVSLIGTWLQQVAQAWLVLTLTNSAFWVGVVTALSTLPVLFFALFGGVIVDRLPTRRILIFTNITQMLFALTLGLLTIAGLVTVWHICILAFLLGTITALDTPARQSFAVELVNREHLSSAIALNAATFNGARIIGPALAGLSIAIFGTGGTFILNAVSFIPPVIALSLMHLPKFSPKEHKHPLKEIWEAIMYAWKRPLVKLLLGFAGVLAIFGWTYTTILPVMARDVFHVGAAGLGYLNTFAGVGAICAAVFISTYGKRLPSFYVILIGNVVFGISLLLFSFVPTIYLAFPLLIGIGFGLLAQFATMNAMLQHMVDDNIRGRVLSIYTIMFMGLSPIGSFQIGAIAEHFGSQFAIRLDAIVIFITGSVLFFMRHKIVAMYKPQS